MVTIIGTFNEMLLRLPTLRDTQGRLFEHVFHVEVRNTLSTQPASYKRDWDNELHPEPPGFVKVAERFSMGSRV